MVFDPTYRDVLELVGFIFILGGVWRDVRSTMKTVAGLKSAYVKDRQMVVALVTQHNMNHHASIEIPEYNGNGG